MPSPASSGGVVVSGARPPATPRTFATPARFTFSTTPSSNDEPKPIPTVNSRLYDASGGTCGSCISSVDAGAPFNAGYHGEDAVLGEYCELYQAGAL